MHAMCSTSTGARDRGSPVQGEPPTRRRQPCVYAIHAEGQTRWSGFDIRCPPGSQSAKRTSNPKLHELNNLLVVFSIVTFARDPAASDANVRIGILIACLRRAPYPATAALGVTGDPRTASRGIIGWSPVANTRRIAVTHVRVAVVAGDDRRT